MDYLQPEKKTDNSSTVIPGHVISRFETEQESDIATAKTPFSPNAISVQADIPVQIGQYSLLEEIGKGGMGTIYHVKHLYLQRDFAMKVINLKYLDDPNVACYFYSEILAMGRLQHPNIVQTTDAGNEAGRQFLVMELLKGRDLAKLVQERGPLDVEQALEYLKQSAQGLAAAHRAGFVHRDVKPANLFLTDDNVIKLLDLGLAIPTAKAKDAVTGHMVGSPGFMAPEQILKEISDQRSDIYSLGFTFYFMLTGHLPFESPEYPNVQSLLYAQVAKDRPPLSVHRNDLSLKSENLVQKMTAKNPEDRFQSMEELADAIEKPSVYISRRRRIDRVTKNTQWKSNASAMLLMLFVLVFSFSMFGSEWIGHFSSTECGKMCAKPVSCTNKTECSSEAIKPSPCEQPCPDMSTFVCRSECYTPHRSPEKRECW